MPSAYSLLPTSGSAPTGTVPKRLNAFLRRRPLLTSSLLISLLLVLYLSVFESEHLPDKATISNPTKWTPPSLSGWGSSYDDDGAGAGGGRGKAGMAKAAAERQRCEALWREDGRTAPGGAVVGEGLGEGWSNTGIVGGEGGQDDDEGFSLEREIKKGRDRKDVLREMVSKTNGYYVRDYPLYVSLLLNGPCSLSPQKGHRAQGFSALRVLLLLPAAHGPIPDCSLPPPGGSAGTTSDISSRPPFFRRNSSTESSSCLPTFTPERASSSRRRARRLPRWSIGEMLWRATNGGILPSRSNGPGW
jgi:hypothetical protein